MGEPVLLRLLAGDGRADGRRLTGRGWVQKLDPRRGDAGKKKDYQLKDPSWLNFML